MKILHITPSYKPAYIYGGPIQSVGKLCEEMSRLASTSSDKNGNLKSLGDEEKLNINVLTTTANGIVELDVKTGQPFMVNGVRVTYFKRWTKDHSHFSTGLLSYLRNDILGFDHNDRLIIHIHAWWNLVSVLSCFIAKWYRVPVVLSPRGMLTTYSQNNRNSFSKKLLHNIIGKRLLQYCHIHATSEQEKDDIQKIISPKSIAVIPNLVNLEDNEEGIKYQGEGYLVPIIKYQQESSGNEKLLNLIFLSRIEEKKGLELLFGALAQLEINWQITIAGSGNNEYVKHLKDKAKSLNLNSRITWIGQVNNEEKYKLMAKHDLLVLTSYNENFANVVVESLSVGTPVLISDQVGISDYVIKNELGWICELNPEGIKDELVKAFSQQEKRDHIRLNAPALITHDFDDTVLANKYLKLYQQLLR
ncbi:glycosyltransferase [Pedobacter sp. G11]|uniref:XrtY-associated glycosyltransferase XYAG1 n=1 Tax=Pedobacter sp. G11 TaxID=2482728 RepID=UPI000F5E7B7B|nr:glycosyltransferase [Pedobacter sp. G11]AZI25829.1 glycosyltransferase [Pedobacter sp. G11]